jgi:hypothetical protein
MLGPESIARQVKRQKSESILQPHLRQAAQEAGGNTYVVF